ncbi:phosphonate ABC transporter substrate-binding protein [Arthrobacter sp. MYb211]|uniref:phosphate/phosphite/phosphonate ABC transporter substrate-binding protein n=1 Tax=Micrococcaceae TaxID=1268 RepID=UPI000CFBED63|nr:MULTISPECIES: phosphate/phosphite/phosphonate ABC transporter substrate-binding protein [unclassified Arthrobacter]PQZ96590.1 phosphonate ABC transporter substrate-binding protein [Arthrobacter sp. MYb224]PRA01988.1 phosphonate ABC transporter substrate-binding protein [Arthrobacter sp. MYb229]PRA13166.1 phosphonate ABC transporter substrate-binding protein [Arthrobacter sp. MYb221]PRB50497.1 phosphonate ABC transporter substrate-binding protein [Arthrobacter sp. MYb216]PRC10359.1 phosphona
MKLSRTVAVAASAIGLVALSACGSPQTQSEAVTDVPAFCADGPLMFGIEPFEAPAKLEPAYGVLANALERELGCKVEMQVVEDYSAEVLAMRNGKLDLGQFGPVGYVFASEQAGAEPLVSFGTAEGELSTYTAGIWVPKDSDITSIEQLRDADLALGGVGSTSGDVLPRYALKTAGVAESELNLNYAGGHPESLLALTNGTVDAAQINSQTLAVAKAEGTFDPADYREIWTSEPIPNDPITIRADADPALKEAVKTALLELPEADIAQVGAFLDVTPPGPLLEVTKDTYQPLFDLAAEMGLTEKDL